MPYIKPRAKPFWQMHKLLRGNDINADQLAAVLGCSRPTAKKKLDNPELLTLADLGKINLSGHIPIEDIRDAIVR